MLSEKLLIPIRLLTIAILCVVLYSAVQGALVVKELRDTVHTRLANDQFPVPTNGLLDLMQNSPLQSAQQALDPSSVRDADVSRQIGRVNSACGEPGAECVKQVGLLCDVLKQKGFAEAGLACDDARSALERGDEQSLSAAVARLQSVLAKH